MTFSNLMKASNPDFELVLKKTATDNDTKQLTSFSLYKSVVVHYASNMEFGHSDI